MEAYIPWSRVRIAAFFTGLAAIVHAAVVLRDPPLAPARGLLLLHGATEVTRVVHRRLGVPTIVALLPLYTLLALAAWLAFRERGAPPGPLPPFARRVARRSRLWPALAAFAAMALSAPPLLLLYLAPELLPILPLGLGVALVYGAGLTFSFGALFAVESLVGSAEWRGRVTLAYDGGSLRCGPFAWRAGVAVPVGATVVARYSPLSRDLRALWVVDLRVTP